jgi:hypothetical protein
MKCKILLQVLLMVTIFGSCRSQQAFYNKSEADWETKNMPDIPVKYSVYLLGSINEDKDSSHEVFEMLQEHIDKADSNHAVVFLSDHIYENGLPEEGDSRREAAEKKIDERLNYLANDKGQIFFIAGNHDIIKDKIIRKEAALRTKNYVEKKLGKENIFLPEDGCPGPAEISLNRDLVFVPLNTEWWLQDKDEKNNNCENKKMADWMNALKDIVDNNQRKNILVLGHHPLFNAGNHGGYFSLKQHIFPFTDLQRNLYIPLPVIGSLYPLFRAGIGFKHDIAYPRYKSLRRNLLKTIKGYSNVIYASGHEHNLQYFKYEKQDFIITNSSNNISWTGKRKAAFTYANKGFVKLNYLENGEIWMEIFVPDENKKEGALIFRKRLKDNVYGKQNDTTLVDSAVSLADSTITVAADENLKAGKFVETFLGKHYREAWTTPVKIPLLDLNNEQGGLEIIKKGGGFQTKSLRLRSSDGEEFSLRSVSKYPERLLGKEMLNTLAADIEKDQTTSTNPYSPMVVASLSDAAGILHSNPKIVYIPNDRKLAEYRKDFANTLALFEQRADGKFSPAKNFGNTTETISSFKLLKILHRDNADKIDEYLLLKSRLFDIWINDWDRHEDQWRWGIVKCNDENAGYCKQLKAKDKYYIPIPRDRDQAFAKFDGIMPWIAGRKWLLRKFQDFKSDIRDVPGFNFNARNFDHAFLTGLSREDWNRIANELKMELTDEKIDNSVRQFPDDIYKIYGSEVSTTLKSRRDNIPSFARRYYDFLSQYVDVVGSDKKEIFEINRVNDDSTLVTMYDQENGEKGRVAYARTFKTDETKEVRIYGMGGDDIFNVTGSVNKGILIRIIGGDGKDSITDASHVSGWCKKTKVYDDKHKNILSLGHEAQNLTSADKNVNDYDYFSYNYNVVAPATFFGYNVDDGVFLGGGIMIRRQGFRKIPYASYQRIVANVAVKDGSFNFKYTGDFNNVIGKWGMNTDFSILAPRNTTNFFGLGNETVKEPVPDSYYKLRFDGAHLYPSLKRRMGKYNSLRIGPFYQYLKFYNIPERYITSAEGQAYLNDYAPRNLGGGILEYNFQNIDDSVLTRRGIKWTTSVSSQSEIQKSSVHPTNVESQLLLYIPLPNRSTLALRGGGAKLFGDFEFFQANTLGGQNVERQSGNLRGYLRGRYAGRSTVYMNADLRVPLLRFHTYLFPGFAGVLAFYDQGRVWNDNETSDTWHSGYGGGVWMSPIGMAIVNFTYAVSKEEKLFTVSLGFLF